MRFLTRAGGAVAVLVLLQVNALLGLELLVGTARHLVSKVVV
jgi:hypothetical protein